MKAHRGKIVSNAEFARLWNSTLSLNQIGVILNVSGSAVQHRAAARGLKPRGKGCPPRFTPPAEFRAMWLAKVRVDDMAKHFGVNEKTIRNAVRRAGLLPRYGNRSDSITITKYREMQTIKRMAEVAAQEREAARQTWRMAA